MPWFLLRAVAEDWNLVLDQNGGPNHAPRLKKGPDAEPKDFFALNAKMQEFLEILVPLHIPELPMRGFYEGLCGMFLFGFVHVRETERERERERERDGWEARRKRRPTL